MHAAGSELPSRRCAMSQQAADDKQSVAVDVSVIMPACNAAGYLAQSLRSVLAQTLTNLQLVIVDDGSVDDTPDIARSVRDDRVVVLSGPNRGPSHARNAGIAAARPSPYVAFIDADD